MSGVCGGSLTMYMCGYDSGACVLSSPCDPSYISTQTCDAKIRERYKYTCVGGVLLVRRRA